MSYANRVGGGSGDEPALDTHLSALQGTEVGELEDEGIEEKGLYAFHEHARSSVAGSTANAGRERR